jgi:hypothetical protein
MSEIINEAAPIDPKVFNSVVPALAGEVREVRELHYPLGILPQKIKLDGDLAKRLKKLNDKQVAVQSFVQMIARQGEERIAELTAEGRQVWQDVAARYKIDLDRVQWNLDNDGETIVPVGMRLT